MREYTTAISEVFDLAPFTQALENLHKYSIQINRNLVTAGEAFARYTKDASEVLFKKAKLLADTLNVTERQAKKIVGTVFGAYEQRIKRLVSTIDREISNINRKIEQITALSSRTGRPLQYSGLVQNLQAQVEYLERLKTSIGPAFTLSGPEALARTEAKLNAIRGQVAAITTEASRLEREFLRLSRGIARAVPAADALKRRIEFVGGTKQITTFQRIINNIRRWKQEIKAAQDEINAALKRGEISLNEYYEKQRVITRKINALKKQEVAFEKARIRELDRIRGAYLSRIARGLESHPFSPHELAKPAEILTTSMIMAGPIQTMKSVWAEARKIAAEEGRKTSAVFLQSMTQYGKQQFSRAFGAWLGAALTTFPIFYGVVNTISEINRQYNDLVEVSRYVQSATYQVGSGFESLTEIMGDVIHLSVKTGQSFRTVGEVMWELKSAGFGMKEAIAGTEAAIRLITLAGRGVDAAKSARIVAGLYRLFKDEFKDITDESERFNTIMGKVVYTLNRSQIGLDELLKSFEYFGSTAKATGMTLEQMLSYLAILSNERLPGVGRAARQAANQIAQAIPALAAKYGIILDVTKPLADQLGKIFSELNKRIKDGTVNLAEFSFWMKEAGIRGGPAIIAIARNWDSVVKLQNELIDGARTLGMTYGKFYTMVSRQRMDYFVLQWNRLKAAMLGLTAIILHPVKQGFASLFKLIADGIEKISEAIDKLSHLRNRLRRFFIGEGGWQTWQFTTKDLGIDVTYWQKQLDDALKGHLTDIIKPGGRDARIAEFSQKFAAAIYSGVVDYVSRLDVGLEVKSALLEKLKISPADIEKAIRSHEKEISANIEKALSTGSAINPADIEKIIRPGNIVLEVLAEMRDRFTKVAKSVGLTTDKLHKFGSSAIETKAILASIDDIFNSLNVSLMTAVSGKRGLSESFKTMQDTFKSSANALQRIAEAKKYLDKITEKKEKGVITEKEYKKALENTYRTIEANYKAADFYLYKFLSSYASFKRSVDETISAVDSLTKKTKDPWAGLIADLDKYKKLQSDIAALLAVSGDKSDDLRKNLLQLAQAYEEVGKKDIAESLRRMAEETDNLVEKLKSINWETLDIQIIQQYVDEFTDSVHTKALQALKQFASSVKVDLVDAAKEAGVQLSFLGIAAYDLSDPFEEAIRQLERLIEKLKEQGESIKEATQALDKLRRMQEQYNILKKEVAEEGAERLKGEIEVFGTGDQRQYRLKRGLLQLEKEKDRYLSIGKKIYKTNKEAFEKTFGTWEEFEKKVGDSWEKAQERFRKEWKRSTDFVYKSFVRALNRIQDYMSDVFFRFFKGQIKSLSDLWEGFMDILRRTAAELISGWISGKMKKAFEKRGDSSDMFGWLDRLLPSKLPSSILDRLKKIIPFFAEGGYVAAPTLAVVGEREPEYIIPQSKIDRLATHGGGAYYTIIINAIDSRSFEEYVKRNSGPIITVVNDALSRNTNLTKNIRSLV